MRSFISLALILAAGNVAADETKEQISTRDAPTAEEHKHLIKLYQQAAKAKALQEQVEVLQEQLEDIPYEVDLPVQKD